MKTVNVSYSVNQTAKSLAVPLVTQDFKFGTDMSDPVWKLAAQADDFVKFPGSEQADQRSSLALFRNGEFLFLGFFFCGTPRIKPPSGADGSEVWQGEMAEIHFGGLDPEPWLLQLGVGIAGGRFDSSGRYGKWQAAVFENADGWGAELKISLDMLKLAEGALLFNLCRQSVGQRGYYTWSPLQCRFHEVENFGQLFFTGCREALSLRGACNVPENLDRAVFEKELAKLQIPADRVIHGPFVSAPENSAVSISWETAGKVPAFLEYYPAGEQETRRRVFCGKKSGILFYETLHRAELDGLTPGTEYIYELFSLAPVTEEEEKSGVSGKFVLPSVSQEEFSFAVLSDLHSDVEFLSKALKTEAVRKSSFLALLGDNLSHAAGREALYEGVLDPVKKSCPELPLVFVRGNHEQLGIYASEYFNVMGHRSGRSYYSFTYGKVFFIVLDGGNDKTDDVGGALFSNREMLEEERIFLEKTVESGSYRKASCRIVLLHIPPVAPEDGAEQFIYRMLEPLHKSEIKPDVMLSGHVHRYLHLEKNSSAFSEKSDPISLKKTLSHPFPVIANGNDTVLNCRVSSEELEITVLRLSKSGQWQVVDTIKAKFRL